MRSRILLAILLVAVLLGRPYAAAAQVRAISRADTAAILLEAARAFQAEGRWEVAEALFHFILDRYGETPSGTGAREALRDPDPEGARRSGEVELMVWGTTYGLWLGVAIPGALGADDPAPYGVGLLLGGPGGFLGGRALARSGALSPGQVRAITFGSFWGTWQGFGLLEVMDWGVDEHCFGDLCEIEDPDGADVLKAMVIGGLAGVATGALLARRPITSGVATTASFGALWGSWFGFAGGVLADQEGDALLATTLLGGDAGLVGAALAAPQWKLSRNRARLISISGVIGLLGGFGLDLIIQPDDEKAVVGIPLVTSLVGLGIGWGATDGQPAEGAGERATPVTPSGTLGAVLSLSDGGLTLAPPAPFPTLLPVDGPRRFSLRPGVGIKLFSAHF
jgi:hypothetical protein